MKMISLIIIFLAFLQKKISNFAGKQEINSYIRATLYAALKKRNPFRLRSHEQYSEGENRVAFVEAEILNETEIV